MKTSALFPIVIFMILMSVLACGQQTGNMSVQLNDTTFLNKPDSFWKRVLSPGQYYILREKGTEKPYSGKWLMHEDSGIYTCAACGYELFNSDSKFDSHCGWPSFDEEMPGARVKTATDNSHGMSRTEIMCARCGGHLGHLFDDGPTSSGKRYCVNSVSLEFVKAKDIKPETDTLTLGAGCFWCVEAIFERLKGVLSVESGYSGGNSVNPTYEEVCSGNTGHAEVVQIVFNPSVISMGEILKVFFSIHDPTSLNRQGADIGTQYRSAIFYRNNEQKILAASIIDELNKADIYDNKICTALEAFTAFYKAEISHQEYYKNNSDNSYCRLVIQPKMEKFEKVFKDKLKKE